VDNLLVMEHHRQARNSYVQANLASSSLIYTSINEHRTVRQRE
jgi:hypothetical protein